ncbi:MAG: T9SS type A sorting domain-containing protein [Saprospiraceae bacterium]
MTDHPDTCGYDLVLKGKLTDTMIVLLDWLYPESNNIPRTYLVEYSLDNNTFTTLRPPDSTAQATGLVHYFHTHRTPVVGANYYRVILSDSQGQKLTSNVVEITKDSVPPEPEGDYFLVHSYPNPFKDKITVDVYDWFEGLPITVELINTLGQITYFAEIPTGTTRFEIETADFASGTYFLFVRYDGKPQKIFKLVR